LSFDATAKKNDEFITILRISIRTCKSVRHTTTRRSQTISLLEIDFNDFAGSRLRGGLRFPRSRALAMRPGVPALDTKMEDV
jgi:hypothetical protein